MQILGEQARRGNARNGRAAKDRDFAVSVSLRQAASSGWPFVGTGDSPSRSECRVRLGLSAHDRPAVSRCSASSERQPCAVDWGARRGPGPCSPHVPPRAETALSPPPPPPPPLWPHGAGCPEGEHLLQALPLPLEAHTHRRRALQRRSRAAIRRGRPRHQVDFFLACSSTKTRTTRAGLRAVSWRPAFAKHPQEGRMLSSVAGPVCC
jgi:hypothetical protein